MGDRRTIPGLTLVLTCVYCESATERGHHSENISIPRQGWCPKNAATQADADAGETELDTGRAGPSARAASSPCAVPVLGASVCCDNT
uniref:Uncharacterized protein n=1 Tax=Arundo donax TaxID=35708 RepID=A0A0A9D303_ARUDO